MTTNQEGNNMSQEASKKIAAKVEALQRADSLLTELLANSGTDKEKLNQLRELEQAMRIYQRAIIAKIGTTGRMELEPEMGNRSRRRVLVAEEDPEEFEDSL